MAFTSTNPYNQQTLKTYRADSHPAIEHKLKQADRAFADWSALSLAERTDYLRKVGRYLIDNKQRYGELITAEMGKTLKEAVAEVEKCATTCTFYAGRQLTVGDYQVAAVYSGFSSTDPLVPSIWPGTVAEKTIHIQAETSLQLTTSATPVVPGQPVTLTATAKPIGALSSTGTMALPTGYVYFEEGGFSIGGG